MEETARNRRRPAGLSVHPESSSICLDGPWTTHGVRGLDRRVAELIFPGQEAVTVDASAVSAFDTAGALLLQRMTMRLSEQNRNVRIEGLTPGGRELLNLVATSMPPLERAVPPPHPGLLEQVGRRTWDQLQQVYQLIAFIGEVFITLARNLARPARIPWRLLAANLEDAGVHALPIVGLLSFLLGIVIAYQGGVQLRVYGANIFIVDLVTVTMLREIGPVMAAVIVAGRSGSAYAAQIATMQVTEEVDALRTIGAGPLDLLVCPKLLALLVALPLLTVFSDVAGVFGGMVMASAVLGVHIPQFIQRIPHAVSLTSVLVGIVKTPVFAAIIAIIGSFQGFRARGDADSVGEQTTLSVVQAIFWVIVADAVFSILFSWFKI